ncbi:Gfo/Idh/MocA family oxidoreductase [Rubellicoccus peritrichatus]|uniref:Gfo/Idh/MocA family oxidoreductase n=1 Tax=Rubellicoccus peritrichatus TaxID=3080537 RepID=A0AAQ3QT59_9BACT|nr:Gfo/Idh/MocA family oxidoreductase [Puniceicoccus sp. CR14]WOO40966.1 Gfo/Idh/MocA family oxidoreductase [Puniceicoccus sp. CR14]
MVQQFKEAKEIRVGVVGYGGAFNMGKHHLKEMEAAGMTPVAVTEMDPERLAVATKDYPGIGTFDSIDAMLAESDVNLITLITPHNTHAPLGVQALEAGRHVVCEKPLAITTAECDAMIAAAEKSGVMLSTYHNRHWDGLPRTAVDLVKEQGAIGDVYKIDCRMGSRHLPGDWWRSSKTISGGVMYDWGVHLLEYALQVIDSEITEVSGYAKKGFWAPQIKWAEDSNEDEARAVVRFANGVWLTLTISTLDSDPKQGIVEISGTEGSIVFGDPHNDYRLIQWKDGNRTTTEGKQLETVGHRYYENVAAYLTGKADLIITPEWSRRPIHILDLADQSAATGKALSAKYA